MKKIAWVTNLTNVGALGYLSMNGFPPMYGAITCGIAIATILIACLPEALKECDIIFFDDDEA